MNTEPKTRALMERALRKCDVRKMRRALNIAQKRYTAQGEWVSAGAARLAASRVSHQIRRLRRLMAEAKADGLNVDLSIEDVTVNMSLTDVG
ncbi:hypothetical protein [Ralstonia phage phiRSL1]|uniref:Uncharacterized protein n=1 Tax=Ralstonia phage phiRSL1 TaxID=1980924 RepID=B2ZXT3_9CAUD|nr:hypothetical protein RSL1_ORF063 [Ralstonia phage phiRSL1]BAG41509.1 hypothetical protein [Ralstonia phage phiRSL1]